MVHVLLPVVAGCVAPGLKAVGLFVWADCWAHDAVALNGFKSSLATGLFAVLVAALHRRAVAAEVVGWLALSSAASRIPDDVREILTHVVGRRSSASPSPTRCGSSRCASWARSA